MKRFVLSFVFTCLLTLVMVAQRPENQSAAQNVVLTSPTGDTLDLYSLKGKVVLVDFWASWCGPCRLVNRNLKALYDKYQPKGFEIFSVNIDNDTARWRAAIAMDQMNWIQVNQRGNWQAPILRAWGVSRLPMSFLLDAAGRFVAIDPSYGVLDKWLESLLDLKNSTR